MGILPFSNIRIYLDGISPLWIGGKPSTTSKLQGW